MYLWVHLLVTLCAHRLSYTYSALTVSAVSTRAKHNNAGRKYMAATIFLLYILTTTSFSFDWAFQRYAYVSNGETFYTVFLALEAVGPWWRTYRLVTGITGGINTVLADIAMVSHFSESGSFQINLCSSRSGGAGSSGVKTGPSLLLPLYALSLGRVSRTTLSYGRA